MIVDLFGGLMIGIAALYVQAVFGKPAANRVMAIVMGVAAFVLFHMTRLLWPGWLAALTLIIGLIVLTIATVTFVWPDDGSEDDS